MPSHLRAAVIFGNVLLFKKIRGNETVSLFLFGKVLLFRTGRERLDYWCGSRIDDWKILERIAMLVDAPPSAMLVDAPPSVRGSFERAEPALTLLLVRAYGGRERPVQAIQS